MGLSSIATTEQVCRDIQVTMASIKQNAAWIVRPLSLSAKGSGSTAPTVTTDHIDELVEKAKMRSGVAIVPANDKTNYRDCVVDINGRLFLFYNRKNDNSTCMVSIDYAK